MSDETRPDDPPDGGEQLRLSVPEMDCASCAGKVETSVAKLPGVLTVDPQPTTGVLTVTYDPDVTDRAAIAERVEAAGYEVLDDLTTLTLSVPEMDCASCAGKVENALASLDGVVEFDTRPTAGTVVVEFDPEHVDAERIVAAVEDAGYPVTDRESDGGPAERESVWTSPRAIKTWVSGVFVAAGLSLGFLFGGALFDGPTLTLAGADVFVADLLFVAAVAVGGQAILRNGYYSARNRNLDIDLLMSIAILGALLVSVGFGERLYFEAATLAFLFSVAELLERYSMDRARDSLRELMDLSPDEAVVRRDGEEVTVPVEDVQVGEVVVVQPGTKVPLDGEVVNGSSAVNQAPVTGESVPVDKTTGDTVYAGTINEEGYLEVQVTAKAGDDTLSRVTELVEAAQADETEREQFVERFAGYYTPIVVGFAVLVAVVPPLLFGAPLTTYVVYGLTLLVLACPCAFVISTPVTVVSGITSAAKNGVLVKGGSHLEAMGEVDVVAFDKTGTLTKGELVVTDVVPLGENTEADVLACARGLETRSEHPIGEAIVTEADDRGVDHAPVENFASITGKGVEAELGGDKHYAGKPGLFEDLGFDLSHVHAATDGGVVTRTSQQLCERHNCLDLLEKTVPALQAEGKTVVLVGTEDELEGVIAVADEVRPEARAAVARLKELGIEKTVMLTGDNRRTARAVADQVGIDEVHAELLPEEKTDVMQQLVADHRVAMVGDGINDAPALATADVGIAMGAAGTDTAIETADIALLSDDLSKLPYLYELSTRANGVIRQNIWVSLGAKALLALGVPLGLVPIWAAVLVGDAGMTTAVTGNAMRLSAIEAEPLGDGGESPDEPAG
ncbi:heavy metal translocating P-type ATPase [Halorarius litoreus]|uniref:heavy metal translocating P-type ATPase n=1 Tax=Halorarius litoreus TaxID=2962676 RepID=UPI0020CB89B0|nr:cation-translocating P-type ATPase [Halorarius litoreus]